MLEVKERNRTEQNFSFCVLVKKAYGWNRFFPFIFGIPKTKGRVKLLLTVAKGQKPLIERETNELNLSCELRFFYQ